MSLGAQLTNLHIWKNQGKGNLMQNTNSEFEEIYGKCLKLETKINKLPHNNYNLI